MSRKADREITDNCPYGKSVRCWCLPARLFTIAVLLIAVILTLNNCTPKTSDVSLPIDSLENFSQSGFDSINEHWWTAFHDSQLNMLVDSAMNSNFDLISAWYQLQAAEAVVKRESSFLLPDIEAAISGAFNRPQPDFVGGENLQVGLRANYELDLWGRIRSLIKAEEYREEATYADYQTAAISLSGEIARTWYQLIAAQNQLNLIEQQIETNEDIVRLIKARFGGGQTRGVDILRQMQLLESTREQRIMAETTVEVLEHQLAILVGRQPQIEMEYRVDSLPVLPPLPSAGIPVQLVERRPDVRGSFYQLLAADRQLAAAITNRYPRITFRTSLQMRANSAEALFNDWAYSLGFNLVAPLLYWGRLRAEVDRTRAEKNRLLYQYGQVVLLAFREVEDALIQEQKQRERIDVIEEQLDLVIRTNRQLRIEYLNGMSGYLDVLVALDNEQQLRRDLISAKLGLIEFRIALYRALAGSFETERELDNDA